MKLYERIVNILDEKGPLPFPALYHEASSLLSEKEGPFDLGEVQNTIFRKKDLFFINNEMVSIHPDKKLSHLHVYSEMPGRPACQAIIDFEKGKFIYTEWRDKGSPYRSIPRRPFGIPGDMAIFKAAVFSLAVWDWEQNYIADEGIILNGTSWYVILKSKTKVYKSSGFDRFPENWQTFRSSLQELTGSPYW
ncbi:hypothetical protein A8F94_02655 [Bacillus sp. FJAT-27225]|uniref:hypothetical protein n=1 Tax=Bacillus sp. FJAT-27225 TaxID=1743144 RepID=UPI00080C24BA|nr:hypothetical protein [Bacillus sp. FJAT-27225]OCA90794.1 hypothetical protein A8F94_02655 [Bacillus sp. FJAT-27225]